MLKKTIVISIVSVTVLLLMGSLIFNTPNENKQITKKDLNTKPMDNNTKLDTATFGEGCFWCTEAIFQRLKGVKEVISGYSGGHAANPSYEEVCTGSTGHAEACQIIFDPNTISYDELLKVFWKTHDPTTLNRQGNDIGTQYRSVIFYHNEMQKNLAEKYKKGLDASGAYERKIVTAIEPYKNFYKAADYHQNYYNNNSNKPYCAFVIGPKLDKFEKVFKNDLKKNSDK